MHKDLTNNGRHIYKILSTTVCRRHDAGEGTPCFTVNPGSKTAPISPLIGVCGLRIKKAGYNGSISTTSFQTRRPSGSKPFTKKKEANR